MINKKEEEYKPLVIFDNCFCNDLEGISRTFGKVSTILEFLVKYKEGF